MFASKDSMRNHLDDEMLSAYMDRALPAGEMQRAQRHLAACAECRQRLETLQGVVRLLHALPAVEVPRSFVLRPADVQPARPSPAFVFLRAATVAVAMMLAVVLAGDLLLHQGMLGMPAAPAPVMERAAMPAPATLIAEAPALVTPEAVPATVPAEAPAAKALVPPELAPTEAPPATPEAGAVMELMAAPTPLEAPVPTETPATPEMMAAGIEVSATPTLPAGTLTPGVEVTLTAPAVALPQVAVAAASETPHLEEPTATALAKTGPLPTPAEGTPGASPSEVIVEPPVTSPDEVPAPPGVGGGGGIGGGAEGMGGAGGIGGAPPADQQTAEAVAQTATAEAAPAVTAEALAEALTPTPTSTATPTPQAMPTPTPQPAEAGQAAPTPAAPTTEEPATAVAQRAMPAAPATAAAPEQAPVPAPEISQGAGFFNEDTLFLIRLVEIALALIVVSLAGATWVVRPRA